MPDRLTEEEAAKLAALPDPHGFVCRLALGTGLRWGELCRAQAADVKRLQLPGAVEGQWFLEVSNTKSRKVRRVPLSPGLVREVRTRVGRLVPYAEGSPGSFAKAAGRLAGVADFHVHRMRHTFACQWCEQGCHQACKVPRRSALKSPHPTPTTEEVRDGESRRS